jgi:NAD(P)-dependent dehydrogenase (short-subunit alcohol dehydrogenase family)
MAQQAKVAVVTGGNRGMGLATARALATQGMRVVLTARDGSAGEAAAAGLREAGLDVQAFTLDVTDRQGAERLAWWLWEGSRKGAKARTQAPAPDQPPLR